MGYSERSSLAVTLSVWRALFLREAVGRVSKGRSAWLWLLMEPLFHTVYLMFLFSTVRVRVVAGMTTAVWIMIGVLTFFVFKRTGMQAMHAVRSNEALFTYRQVKPVDTVLVRAALEGFLGVLLLIIMLVGAGLFGLEVVPDDPLYAMGAFFGMWLMGLGFGLMTSVAAEMVPELGNMVGMAMTPLYFISGVIFPIDKIPSPYREWLMLNPLLHGLEAARQGFGEYYHAVPELNLAYLYAVAIITIFFGLTLQYRFRTRMATK